MRIKLRSFIIAHKFLSVVVAGAALAGGYYWYSAATAAPAGAKYVIARAATGTVVASVSGTGQVQNTATVDIKPQITETVTGVYVSPGDYVRAGQLLVQLDTTNEARAVRQAQLALQSAQLSLESMQEITTSTLVNDQNAVAQDEMNVAAASTTLADDYGNGYDTIASAFVSLQTVMADAGNFANGYDLSRNQADPAAYVGIMPSYLQAATQPYANAVAPAYSAALAAYQSNLNDLRNASRNGPRGTLDALFEETYHTTQLVTASIQSIDNLLNFVTNNYPQGSLHAPLPSITATFQTTYGNDLKTANSEVASVQGVATGIAADANTLADDQLALTAASTTLAQLVAGPTQVAVQTQQVNIETAQNNLQTAEENLADDSIRAPVAGIVSAVPATVGASVPNPAVSMVSGQQVAEVTLNEVDAASVNIGDKAMLTFDAINGLNVRGKVIEIDPVGTVSQGVVNYNIQVSMTESSTTAEVKPGMSVTANIVTGERKNVVAVPASAVITLGSRSFVLEPAAPVPADELAAAGASGIMLPAAPKRVPVTVGLVNDSVAEIVSGVAPGDQVIVQTVQGGASAAAAPAGGAGGPRPGRFFFGKGG